jgi:hypothetical protein
VLVEIAKALDNNGAEWSIDDELYSDATEAYKAIVKYYNDNPNGE